MSQDQVVEAIVLVRRDSGESDRWLRLLSKESGVIDAIAKGARKPNSRLATISEPLATGILHLSSGRHRSFITQVQPTRGFPGLRRDLERLVVALSLAEIYASIARHGGQGEEEYDQLVQDLASIESHEAPGTAWITAVIRLLALEGVTPSWNRCVHTGCAIAENPVRLSPSQGGYVSLASGHTVPDCVIATAEAALSLAIVPPSGSIPKLAKEQECMAVLARFAQALTEDPLAATHQMLSL